MRTQSQLTVALALLAIAAVACNPSSTATSLPTLAVPRDTIVTLTFDDGNADNYDPALALQQHGLRGTWYIPSGLVGTPGYMTWHQLQSLQAAGHEIGGHSLDHSRLDGLPADELRRQICDDRVALQDHGFEALSFAYPFGAYDPAARAMVLECGYLSARTIGAGMDSIPPADPFALRAYPYIVSDTTFSKLQRYVSGVRKEGGGWLVLIFHHVCDNCDYFSVQPEVFLRFTAWLADEQAQGHITVHTVGDIIGNGAP